MAEKIDIYHKWLGIPPDEQPADYYRLLGIKRFESDQEVITNAADRQIRHVRAFQMGPYSAESQELLNEISAARVCLLNEAAKVEYDEALEKELKQPTEEVSQSQPSPEEPSPDNEIEYVTTIKPRVTARRKKNNWKWSTLAVGIVTGVIAGLLFFMAMQDGTDKPATENAVSRKNDLEDNEKPDNDTQHTGTAQAVNIETVPVGNLGTYNVRKDFSEVDNPNGAWSYGYSFSLGGSMTLYPDHLMDENGFYTWRDNRNVNKIPVVALLDKPLPWGFELGPDDLGFHPGPKGEYSIIRWTAPADGTSNVIAKFVGAHLGEKNVFVYHNTDKLFEAYLLEYDVAPSYKSKISVLKGDTIDFAVGVVKHVGGTTTAVSAIIEFTPTPSPK